MSESGGDRTHDLRIKSPLLYQLSYRPKVDPVGLEPTTYRL